RWEVVTLLADDASEAIPALRALLTAVPDIPVVVVGGDGLEPREELFAAGAADVVPDGDRAALERALGNAFWRRAALQGSHFMALPRAERGTQRARLLAEASRALAADLTLQATLDALVHIVVPAFADLAVIDLVEANGTIRRAAGHFKTGRGNTSGPIEFPPL